MPIWVVWLFYLSSNWRFLLHPKWLFLPGANNGFINTVNAATDVDRDWQSYVQQQKQQELEQIIAEEKLKPAEAQRFVANAFRDGALKTTGTDVDQILPPVSRFGGGNRTEKKKTIIQRLAQFFEKYFGI